MQYDPTLKASILEAVDNQLFEESLPEVKETFERLTATGHSKEEAKRLIANILIYEIHAMMTSMKEFNRDRYVTALRKLPELPGDGEYAAYS